MAYILTVKIDYGWVPDGAAGAAMGQSQANFPGADATAGPMPVYMAQTASDQVGEVVPGGDAPTGSNFQTALNTAAAQLYTRLTTTNAVPGFTNGTLLAQVQGFATGGA